MSYSNWMKNAKLQNKRLHELTIPGTHDSGTYALSYEGVENKISKTQTLDFSKQLKIGIRFFDIRVNADDMTLNHGKTRTEVKLADVLTVFKTFLKETDETIIMHVKHEWGDTSNFHTKMVSAIKGVFPDTPAGNSDFSRHVYMKPMRLDGNIPTLGELHGKLVYMRRYGVDKYKFIKKSQQDGADSGIPVDQFVAGDTYNDWSKNPAGLTWQQRFDASEKRGWPDSEGNLDYKKVDFRNRHGLSFVIQDWYSINEAHGSTYSTQCENKIKVVKQYLDKASGSFSRDSWFLNFVNVSQVAYYPRNYAIGGDRCNNRLWKELSQAATPGRYGTIILDFCVYPTTLVQQIIGLNF